MLRLILRRTLLLAVAGVAPGTAGVLAVTRVLTKFPFVVKPTDRRRLLRWRWRSPGWR